jgi:hypothetical protein
MASVLIATDDFCALEKPLWPRLMAVALNRDEKPSRGRRPHVFSAD